jgi:hypothetical protein
MNETTAVPPVLMRLTHAAAVWQGSHTTSAITLVTALTIRSIQEGQIPRVRARHVVRGCTTTVLIAKSAQIIALKIVAGSWFRVNNVTAVTMVIRVSASPVPTSEMEAQRVRMRVQPIELNAKRLRSKCVLITSGLTV